KSRVDAAAFRIAPHCELPSANPTSCHRVRRCAKARRPGKTQAPGQAADRPSAARRSVRRELAPMTADPSPHKQSHVLLLYAARGVRGFGDGFAVIILPAYLSAIGFDAEQIGIVATVALLGSALFTLAVGFFGAHHDLRNLLLAGALVMAATGLAFPNFEHIWLIGLVAFIGTVNPSAGDAGILVPLEHAMLARGVLDHERTRAFARYSLIGALTGAAGSLAAATPDFLIVTGIDRIAAF